MTYEDMARIAAAHQTRMADAFMAAYAEWLASHG